MVKIERRRSRRAGRAGDPQQLTMLAASKTSTVRAQRCVTLTQPWAGLVAAGIKLIENRDKPIVAPERFGEVFGIHASREIDQAVYLRIRQIAPELFDGWNVDDVSSWPLWYRLSRITSAVLGVGTIYAGIGIKPRRPVPAGAVLTPDDLPPEQRRWFFGPIGYALRDVRTLAEPITGVSGGLSNWAMPDDVAARVNAQLARAA